MYCLAGVDDRDQAQQRGRADGVIPQDVDPLYSGFFFLVGLYALLITLPAIESVRGQVLTQYVNTALSGMRIHAGA
jgi:hypothetical protein